MSITGEKRSKPTAVDDRLGIQEDKVSGKTRSRKRETAGGALVLLKKNLDIRKIERNDLFYKDEKKGGQKSVHG